MDDKNKQTGKQVNQQEEAPKPISGATTAKSSSWKRLLAKKWVFPATYMAAAAIILTLMVLYQGSDSNLLSDEDIGISDTNSNVVSDGTTYNPDALPVTVEPENMQWPVDYNAVEVATPFFDTESSNENKLAATIQYEDSFIPSVGISFTRQDEATFDVMAALSGTVTRVEKHVLVGNQVEITHDDGLITVYQSLANVTVKNGDEVAKGDVIAQAGRNELEKNLGVHVRFEVHQDGKPVNPELFID